MNFGFSCTIAREMFAERLFLSGESTTRCCERGGRSDLSSNEIYLSSSILSVKGDT